MPTDEILDVTATQLLSLASVTAEDSQITYNEGPTGEVYTELEDVCYCLEDSAGEYVCSETFSVLLFCDGNNYQVHDFGEYLHPIGRINISLRRKIGDGEIFDLLRSDRNKVRAQIP